MKWKRLHHETLWLNHSSPQGGALLKGTTSRGRPGCLSVESTISNGLFFAARRTKMWRARRGWERKMKSLFRIFLIFSTTAVGFLATLTGTKRWTQLELNLTERISWQWQRCYLVLAPVSPGLSQPYKEKTNSAPGWASQPLSRTQNSTARTITIRKRPLSFSGKHGGFIRKTPGSGAGVLNGTELVRVAFSATCGRLVWRVRSANGLVG